MHLLQRLRVEVAIFGKEESSLPFCSQPSLLTVGKRGDMYIHGSIFLTDSHSEVEVAISGREAGVWSRKLSEWIFPWNIENSK